MHILSSLDIWQWNQFDPVPASLFPFADSFQFVACFDQQRGGLLRFLLLAVLGTLTLLNSKNWQLLRQSLSIFLVFKLFDNSVNFIDPVLTISFQISTFIILVNQEKSAFLKIRQIPVVSGHFQSGPAKSLQSSLVLSSRTLNVLVENGVLFSVHWSP